MKTIDLDPEMDAKLKNAIRLVETSKQFTASQKSYAVMYANYRTGRRVNAPPLERRLKTGKIEQVPEVEMINQTVDKLLGLAE